MLEVPGDRRTSTRCIRLVIADRQPIVLQGLTSVFAAQSDFEIVASCNDGTSCLDAVRNLAPDVALLADTLPDLTTSEILAIAKAENLSTRMVFFTESEGDENLTAAIAAGVCGAISKYTNPDTLLRSLRLMTEHRASPEQSQDLSPNGHAADGAKIEKMLGLLTHRERQIVRLVSEGMSNKEIARKLNLSQGTVKVHLHNIFQKLEISNRTVLAAIALLQRPAGFGTLTLAALAFAIADDLKAAHANDIFVDEGNTADNADAGDEHLEFKLKRAILRHIVDSGETIQLPQRGSATEVSQVANSTAKVESLHAAERAVPSVLGRSPIGSSTPPLSISPLLQDTENSQIGSPVAQQPFPPLPHAANPMKGHGGYGIFTMLAGALIYTLDNSHATAQSLGSSEALIDTSTVVTKDATARVATGPGHREFTSWTDKINLAAFGALAFLQLTSATQSVPPHTLAWIYNPTSNETIVYVNLTDRSLDIGDAALLEIHLEGNVSAAASEPAAVAAALEGIDAALLTLTTSDGTVPTTDSVHAAIGAGANESTHGTAGVWAMPADDGLRFHFGRDRIGSYGSARLTSFGDDSAYATGESDGAASVSAHVSSIELAQSNATVEAEENLTFKTMPIYANGASPTGRGAAHAPTGPLEIGMQSAAIAPPVAVAEPVENGAAPGNSADHRNSQHASEPASATAAATEPENDAGPGNSAGHRNSQHASEPASVTAAATEPVENGAAPGNSAGHRNSQHASEPASVTAAATEPVENGAAPGNSAGHRNSQHSSEPAPTTAVATEPVEANVAPGNSAGHRNSQHASEPASVTAAATEPVETNVAPGNSAGHRNSQHASEPASTTAAATEPVETNVAPGNSAGHGNSQHASAPASVTAAAIEPVETGAAPGNSAGHSNSQHASAPASVTAAATEPVETNVAPGNSAGHGNSQHASEPASATAAATEPVETNFGPGNSAGHGNSQHASEPASVTAAVTEPVETGAAPGNSAGHGNSQHASEPASATAAATEPVETGATPGNSAGHGNSQHASEPASVTAAVTELAEPGFTPGNGVGNGTAHASNLAAAPAPTTTEITESGVVPGQSNSGPPSHSASASVVAGTEPIETGIMPGNSAGHGNSQHASQSVALSASDAAQPTNAAFGGAGQEPTFDFNNLPTPSTPIAAVELAVVSGSPVLLGHDVEPAASLEVGSAAMDQHAAAHVNNGQHHTAAHLPHDLLI
ncbi:MAG: response regulator [Rhizobiales bacterium]|nr:response regulator [Hyphomicrobiales bacterium]